MQKITPNLWFDDQAEQAAEFYVSVFKNSRIVNVTHYSDAGPRPAGMVMTVEFELDGQRFVAINGGPDFTFDEAVSFGIECADQDEVDYYWEQLTAGGSGGTVRLAEGPLRPVVAGRTDGGRGTVRRRGPQARRARDAGDVLDDEARHRGAAARGGRRPRGLTAPQQVR